MRKAEIVELVLRRLEGGDYGDSQYTEAEIMFYMEAAFNKMFKLAANDALSQGVNIPASSIMVKFEVTGFKNQADAPLLNNHPDDYYEITLPVAPINLPNGMGLFKLYPKGTAANRPRGGAFRELVPVPTGQLFLQQGSAMNDLFLGSIDHYEWEEGRTVYAKFGSGSPIIDTQIGFVCILVCNNFAGLSNGDEVNLPQDMIQDVITGTVQLLSGASEDDSSNNFNNKPTR